MSTSSSSSTPSSLGSTSSAPGNHLLIGDITVSTSSPGPLPNRQAGKGIVATEVPDRSRMGFTARMFGPRHCVIGEAAVFDWMGRLCPSYVGAYWHFFELGNGGRYMAPMLDAPVLLQVEGNGFDEFVHPDTAGLVASLFAVCMLMHDGQNHLITLWDRLRDYAFGRIDSSLVIRAID